MTNDQPGESVRPVRVAVDGMNFLYHVARQDFDHIVFDGVDPEHAVAEAALSCLGRAQQRFGATYILVMDGPPQPMKMATIRQRREGRRGNYLRACQAMQEADSAEAATVGGANPVAHEAIERAVGLRVEAVELDLRNDYNLARKAAQEAEQAQAVAVQAAGAEAEAAIAQVVDLRVEARVRSRRAVGISREVRLKASALLRDYGVPVFNAPGEAEAQAAHWAQQGHVDVVASRDFDAFLFGARHVCRNFPDANTVEVLDRIVQESGAHSRIELLSAMVLAGKTDYVGPLTGFWSVNYAIRQMRAVGGFLDLLETFSGNLDPRPWINARKAYLQPLVAAAQPPLVA